MIKTCVEPISDQVFGYLTGCSAVTSPVKVFSNFNRWCNGIILRILRSGSSRGWRVLVARKHPRNMCCVPLSLSGVDRCLPFFRAPLRFYIRAERTEELNRRARRPAVFHLFRYFVLALWGFSFILPSGHIDSFFAGKKYFIIVARSEPLRDVDSEVLKEQWVLHFNNYLCSHLGEPQEDSRCAIQLFAFRLLAFPLWMGE